MRLLLHLRPRPRLILKARIGRKPTEGQAAFGFDDPAHPREPKGSQGDKYKPGEFVPKTAQLTPSANPGSLVQEENPMDQPIVTRTTKAGKTITVRIIHDRDGQPMIATSLDGKEVARCRGLTALKTPKDGATHYDTGLSGVAVGFFPDEVETIHAAYRAAVAALRATPEYQAKHAAAELRKQRQDLVERRAAFYDDAQDAFDRAWDRGDEGKAFAEKKRLTDQAAGVGSQLEAFDQEHPDVLAAIRAEKEAARKRFEATN